MLASRLTSLCTHKTFALALALPLALTACGDSGPGGTDDTDASTTDETGGESDGGSTTDGGTETTAGSDGTDSTDSSTGTTDATTDATAGTTTDATTGTTTDATTTGTTGEPLPEPVLPTPTGACPTITSGDLVFEPTGLDKSRTARIWIDEDAAAENDGPVVFYWHGTGSSPAEAQYGLSQAGVDAITAAGGAVVAAVADPEAGQFPWFLVLGQREDDLILADEILGCIDEQWGVDARRIHAAGMSAGGLMTTQMSYRRSGYIASVVPYSGGVLGMPPASQDPDNKFAAMSFHGGPGDIVIISFMTATETYHDDLKANGHFSVICNHGGGHSIPVPAIPSALQFISDHPYGVESPYANGLPDSFPPYCAQ